MSDRERVPKATSRFVKIQTNVRATLRTATGYMPEFASAWQAGSLRVISTNEIAEYPNGEGEGPTWHISITDGGQRASDRKVKHALAMFGMSKAEEDNHHPGMARHFFMPVDKAHRVDCECKATEQQVREADGYVWSNPKNANECRGCEWEVLWGKPCPEHGQPVVTIDRGGPDKTAVVHGRHHADMIIIDDVQTYEP